MKKDLEAIDMLELVKTADDRIYFLDAIESIIGGLFKVKTGALDLIDQYLPYDKREALSSLFLKYGVDGSKSDSVSEFLSKLAEGMKNLKVVKITLAFAPHADLVNTLSEWINRSSKNPVLIDLAVDLSIIGGVILEREGIYKDYSIKQILTQKYKSGQLNINL